MVLRPDAGRAEPGGHAAGPRVQLGPRLPAVAEHQGVAVGLARGVLTQDVGEARESLPAPYTAEPMEIGFNAEFLRDGLESVESETVKFKLISPLRPAVLEGEADDYLYLIMPIRLAG